MTNIFKKIIDWVIQLLQKEEVKKTLKKILWAILEEVVKIARDKGKQDQEKDKQNQEKSTV